MTPAARTPEELLQRARDLAEPDAGEAGRVLARLRAQLPAANAGSDLPLAAPELSRTAPEPLGAVASGRQIPALRRALLGAGGAVLFGAGFLLGRFSAPPSDATAHSAASTRVEPGAAVANAAVSNAAVSNAAVSNAAVSNAAPAANAAPSVAPSAAEPKLQARLRSPSAPSVRSRAAPTERATNEPLKEALRRLRRAQRALYDNDAARALAVLDDLDRRIAPAVLGEEREMTRILALCGTGELAEARALAKRWVADHPQSIYLTRLHDSCVEPAEARRIQ
jgi:hypothetical protein